MKTDRCREDEQNRIAKSVALAPPAASRMWRRALIEAHAAQPADFTSCQAARTRSRVTNSFEFERRILLQGRQREKSLQIVVGVERGHGRIEHGLCTLHDNAADEECCHRSIDLGPQASR